MKPMICASLSPCFSFSLTWFFKSIARPALESAIVWFWHTRQRNSAARAFTRFSSAGSSAAGAASPARAAVATTNRKTSADNAVARFNKLPSLRGKHSLSNPVANEPAQPCATRLPRRSAPRDDSLLTIELMNEWNDLLLDDLRRERADALVANHSALVDHVGLGRAVHAVVETHTPLRIVGDELVRVAQPREIRDAFFARVLVVQ